MKLRFKFCILLLLIFIGSQAVAITEEVYSIGKVQIHNLTLDPKVVEVGDNLLNFTLKDQKGQPILDAIITVEVFMPAMGTMPKMSSTFTMEHLGQGKYEAELEVSMSGGWEMPILVQTSTDKEATLFPFAISVGGEGTIYKGKRSKVGGESSSSASHQNKNQIYISEPRRQLIGVELGKVIFHSFSSQIRTVARLTYDDSKVHEMQSRFGGDIVHLYADREGQLVQKGEPLFSVYSSDLFTAQDVYLQLLKIKNKSQSDRFLLRSAKEKLEFYNLTAKQIKALGKRSRPPKNQVILSPVTGFVIQKKIHKGSRVRMGKKIYSIANLKKLWALADIYEHQAVQVGLHDAVEINLSYQPGPTIKGEVSYIYPYLDEKTRTLQVRIEVENKNLLLRPGMYADVLISSDKGKRLALPRRAVLFSGQHKYVFVSAEDGYFEPREITTGMQEGDWFEVTSGLVEGDRVSFSANFLISSEAQLRNALPRWGKKKADKPANKPQEMSAEEHQKHMMHNKMPQQPTDQMKEMP